MGGSMVEVVATVWFLLFFIFLQIRMCRSGRFGLEIQRVRIKYLLLRNNAERKDHDTEDT